MTKTEKKVVRYAESVNWDYKKMKYFIVEDLTLEEYDSILLGELSDRKTDYIINKFKPKMETKTKVTALGEEPKKELKRIEVLYCLQARGDEMYNVSDDNIKLEEYDEVILISKTGYYLDVILGKHKDYGDVIFTGHWNDGIV